MWGQRVALTATECRRGGLGSIRCVTPKLMGLYPAMLGLEAFTPTSCQRATCFLPQRWQGWLESPSKTLSPRPPVSELLASFSFFLFMLETTFWNRHMCLGSGGARHREGYRPGIDPLFWTKPGSQQRFRGPEHR